MPRGVMFREIVSKPLLSLKRVRGALLQANQQFAKDVKRDFDAIIETWNHKPKFLVHKTYRGGDSRVEIETYDKAFYYLDRGTRVRHAVMTKDFLPKSRQAFIGSDPGRGGLAYVNSQINRGPIRARNWTVTIRMKWEDDYVLRIQNAINRSTGAP